MALFSVALGWLAMATLAQAQTGATATIRGVVKDAQGGALPGAQVTVTYDDTGVTRQTAADGSGHFVVPELAPGVVTVTLSLQGFAEQQDNKVALLVGQTLELNTELKVGAVKETVVIDAAFAPIDTSKSVVDAVITSTAIEKLPLNGRNFLELRLLVPGNAPAPNFDPTKTSSVLISSAGQLGRGGNITIDGMDNNDDVVGGPLHERRPGARPGVPDRHQPLLRRARPVRGLGHQRRDAVGHQHVARLGLALLPRHALQARPPPPTAARAPTPFDREQVAGSIGGPLQEGQPVGFGAVEYRNQDGAVLVGTATPPPYHPPLLRAGARSTTCLGRHARTGAPSQNNRVTFRYSGEAADDTGASKLDRAIGSASQRQRAGTTTTRVLGTWTRVFSTHQPEQPERQRERLPQHHRPASPGLPQIHVPSMVDGSSFRVPQATDQRRWQFADTLTLDMRQPHRARSAARSSAWTPASASASSARDAWSWCRTSPQFDANGDGQVDDNDLLFAVTLRSGKPGARASRSPNCDNTTRAASSRTTGASARTSRSTSACATKSTPT